MRGGDEKKRSPKVAGTESCDLRGSQKFEMIKKCDGGMFDSHSLLERDINMTEKTALGCRLRG